MTYTYAILNVTPATFEEIRSKLAKAGYVKADATTVDMAGIALEVQKQPRPTPHASAKERKKLRAGKPTL